MSNRLINNITVDFKNQSANVLLVENNDKFLFREDVIAELNAEGIKISQGSPLKHRIDFELRENELLLVLLSDNQQSYLEDITNQSKRYEFFLDKYLGSYHIESIINEDLQTLDKLLEKSHLVTLSKKETLNELNKLKSIEKPIKYDIEVLAEILENELNQEVINWATILKEISKALSATIGTNNYQSIVALTEKANEIFQKELESKYPQLKNSSAIKSPKIVSKILDYIGFNFRNDKIALIVVDGLAWWQYDLFRKKLNGSKNEGFIHSWLPSITQLSRQAIFKGDTPERSYKQNPKNEEKLWHSYWKNKGFNDFEIRYNYENLQLDNLSQTKRLAVVFKDLDDYMHSSKNYKNLLSLTKNWIDDSKVIETIDILIKEDFKVFITSDHGNIQAKGWRSLKGREKLGTNKSGSRSERHIEYSEDWLKDELLTNNPELKDSIVQDEQAIFFKNGYSFSSKESLVTHGGSHLLEVLIPFIEISNEK